MKIKKVPPRMIAHPKAAVEMIVVSTSSIHKGRRECK